MGSAATRGQALVGQSGCTNCHTAGGGRSVGPTWKDLAGSKVTLGDGTKLTADDDYLARSILDPKGQVVDGYAGIMPTYQLTDAQVADVVAYLRQLSVHTRADDLATTTVPATTTSPDRTSSTAPPTAG